MFAHVGGGGLQLVGRLVGKPAGAGRQLVGVGMEPLCGALEPACSGAAARINGPDSVLSELGRAANPYTPAFEGKVAPGTAIGLPNFLADLKPKAPVSISICSS